MRGQVGEAVGHACVVAGVSLHHADMFYRCGHFFGGGYTITLAMSAKRPKGRWVVYELRSGKFIVVSRLFTTRAQAERERDKLTATFTSKQVSLGEGIVVKE
jgi:hypothetical protein